MYCRQQRAIARTRTTHDASRTYVSAVSALRSGQASINWQQHGSCTYAQAKAKRPRDTVRACISVKVSVCPPDRRTAAAATRGRLVRAHLHAIVGRDLREVLSVPRKRESAPRVIGTGDDVSNPLASILAAVTSGDDGGDVVFRPSVAQCCQCNPSKAFSFGIPNKQLASQSQTNRAMEPSITAVRLH